MLYAVNIRKKKGCAGESEILSNILINCGIPQEQIVEEVGRKDVRYYVIFKNKIQAEQVALRLKSYKISAVRVSVTSFCREDWQDKWKTELKPFRIAKKYIIVPAWIKAYNPGKMIPVYIDTNLAFGTGLHETTRFMVELIERKAGNFISFLDVGTGTGLLSIMAQKFGAKRIVALDINEMSIQTARKNFRLNDCQVDDLIQIDFLKFKVKDKFDYVAANLVTQDLVTFRDKLVNMVSPGQYLSISGIGIRNLNNVKKHFRMSGLRNIRTLKGKDWAALLYKKQI